MTGEEIKAKLIELSKPIYEFMKENGIVSFYIPAGSPIKHDIYDTDFDIQADIRPLAPSIKPVLEVNGSIYVVDN